MKRLAALLALLAALPVQAQSFEEAVRLNLGLGLQLCLAPGQGGEARANSFVAAGFAHTVRREANGDTYYTFTAPAGTMSAELSFGNLPEECRVKTDHLGVTGASAVLDAVVPRLYPGFRRIVVQGPPDPATGQPAICVRYEDPANPIGLVIGTVSGPGPAGQGCFETGTAELFQSYRV